MQCSFATLYLLTLGIHSITVPYSLVQGHEMTIEFTEFVNNYNVFIFVIEADVIQM